MARKKFPPIHPGEILLEEFLKPFEISQFTDLPKTFPLNRLWIDFVIKGHCQACSSR